MQRMYLVSPHQLNRLTRSESSSIRQMAEDDLDAKMRAVLNEPGLSQYEKMKKYDALLQRYLALIKQGQKDERQVTLTLHRDPSSPKAEAQPEWEIRMTGEAADEILTNLPPRDRKNIEYILKKLSQSNGGWNSKGEFVYRGTPVKGSHMIDLSKHLSLAYQKKS